MKTVKDGHYVKVFYTGRFENGEIFDSTENCHPLEVHVGTGDVIKGFEDALMGMALNERKTFTLDPDDAYGRRDEALVHTFDRSELPADFHPEVEEVIVLETEEGGQTLATVKQVGEQEVIVDLNHPLAGKSLTFDIEVNEINDEPSPSSCGCGCSCS